MINFQELVVEGGLCFKAATFPLANQGLTMVLGQNRDDLVGGLNGFSSNGSGKTSSFAILEHVLFATTYKGLRKNALKNDGVSTGYHACLKADVNGVALEVHQARDHHKHSTDNWLLKDGVNLKIKGLDKAQAAITEAFGLTLEDWYATVCFAQKYRHLFTTTTQNDLKKTLLARIFQLQYEEYQKLAQEKLATTRTALIQLKASVSSSKVQLEASLQALPYATAEEFDSNITAAAAQVTSLQLQLQTLQQALDSYQAAVVAKTTKENHAKMIQDALINLGIWTGTLTSLEAHQSYIQAVKDQLNQTEQQLSSITNYLTSLKLRDEAYTAYKVYENTPLVTKTQEDLVALEAELKTLEQWITTQQVSFKDGSCFDAYHIAKRNPVKWAQEAELEEATKKLTELINEKTSTQTTLKHENAQLAIFKQGKCGTCLQAIPEQLALDCSNRILELDTRLTTLDTASLELTHSINNMKMLKLLVEEANACLVRLEAQVPEAFRDLTTTQWLANLQQAQDQLRPLKDQILELRTYLAIAAKWQKLQIQGDTAAYEQSQTQLQEAQKQFVSFLANLNQVAQQLKTYESLALPEYIEIDELATKARIATLHTTSIDLASRLAILKRDQALFVDLQTQLKKIQENEAQILKLETNEQIYGALQYAFGPKGLIVSRLEIICRYLTEKVNFYLSRIMRDNISLRFFMDEASIDLDVTMNGKLRGIGNLSGGEEAKVGLACMLGLRSLIPDRYQTNLLICDEPDSGFDDRARFEMLEMLEGLISATSLDSIFLVSHSPALQESLVWDSKWVITKEAGVSTLEVITN